jgi:putative membrane protein
MTLRWLLAAVHLLALAIGLGSVWIRARALTEARTATDPAAVGRALKRAFSADGCWGLAALLWIGSGLWRLFAGLEKPPEYYYSNQLFWTKMLLLATILVLELWPMVTLIRWRTVVAKGAVPDLRPAAALARVSYVQAALVLLMLLAATGMARGLGHMERGRDVGRLVAARLAGSE